MKAGPSRIDARMLVDELAVLTTNKGLETVKLLDISVSGARIELHEPLKNSPKTLQWFPIPGVGMKLKVELLWKRKTVAGIHFVKPGTRERHFLKALIKRHRSE